MMKNAAISGGLKEKINATAVIISLKKQINWDDPQSLSNKESFSRNVRPL